MSSNEYGPDQGEKGRASGSSWQSDPEWIGPYHLLEVLGGGGMGIVYLAEQTAPVHRRVALKIIKLGMDTEEVVRRFEAERQALAVMDHPNIAQVLDGGASETGRPYFVMELVHGVPITDYADTHRLSPRERLKLFLDICAAVQHAHQKGVVHRDLKPSNVLVSVQEDRPVVKVIDFGVAKAIGRRLTDQTLVTHIGQMIGTPEYMSPEQAEMSGLDVDTRTDVYSMGVMLYELIVGALPFDLATRVRQAIPYQLRERETPRPSTRLASLGTQRSVVAERRRTTVDALRRQLKGDLDWIILKAMDKDRTRRYDSVHGLALDVERHLAGEPVLARPPSAGYKVSKFVQRHRAGVAATAIAVAAVLLGAGAAATGFVHARRAQVVAEREAATAKATSDFLVKLFEVNNPSEALGNTITAREILDSGAVQIKTQLTSQPVMQARMMRTIGSVYRELGLYDPARPLLQQAVDLDRTAGDRPEMALSLGELGWLSVLQTRYEEAERELKEGVALSTKLYGDRDIRVAKATSLLGALYVQKADVQDAMPVLRHALTIYRRVGGTEDPDAATVVTNLGTAFYKTGDYDSARVYLRRGLDIRMKVLPPNSPRLGTNWLNLGAADYYVGDYAAAAAAYDHARAIYEKVYTPDHPVIAALLTNLGEIAWKRSRYTDAERDFQRALDIEKNKSEPNDPAMAITLRGLANVYRDKSRYAEADSLYRRSIDILQEVEPNSLVLAESLSDYAELLKRTNRSSEAEAMRARADSIRSANGALR